jgi:hypothetical protein
MTMKIRRSFIFFVGLNCGRILWRLGGLRSEVREDNCSMAVQSPSCCPSRILFSCIIYNLYIVVLLLILTRYHFPSLY